MGRGNVGEGEEVFLRHLDICRRRRKTSLDNQVDNPEFSSKDPLRFHGLVKNLMRYATPPLAVLSQFSFCWIGEEKFYCLIAPTAGTARAE
jgi:hypothetical protein